MTADCAAGFIEVAVRGRWNPALRMAAWAAVTECFVDHPCRAWGTVPVRPRTELIVTDLVDYAVRHTGTDVLVTLTRRGAGIHLAVGDDDPRLPVLRAAPRRADPGAAGQGLRTVHAATTVWGAMPSGTGKVVWAAVHPDPS